MLTLDQASRRFDIPSTFLLDSVRAGQLRAFWHDGRVMVRFDQVEDLLTSCLDLR